MSLFAYIVASLLVAAALHMICIDMKRFVFFGLFFSILFKFVNFYLIVTNRSAVPVGAYTLLHFFAGVMFIAFITYNLVFWPLKSYKAMTSWPLAVLTVLMANFHDVLSIGWIASEFALSTSLLFTYCFSYLSERVD